MLKTRTSAQSMSKLLSTALFFFLGHIIFAQPANDLPCNAISLTPIAWNATCTPAATVSFDNIAATHSGVSAPSCGSYANNDVWFTLTMPSNGFHVELEFSSGTVAPEYGYEVFVGADCNSLTSIDCQTSSSGSNLIIEDGCDFQYAGAEVWIRFWDENAQSGTLDVCAKYRVPNYDPTLGSCPPNFHAADGCCDAIILTDELDGFCGNSSNFAAGPTLVGPPQFIANIENNSWVAFTAIEDSVVIGIEASSCLGSDGLQALIFESNDCSTFNNVSNFWNDSNPGSGILTAPNLTIGETYYIMVDGWGGDICDWSLTYIYGTSEITAPNSSYDICNGQSVLLELETPSTGPYNFSWSPSTGLDDTSIQNPTANPSTTTTYTVHVTGVVDTMFDITVNVFPAAPSSLSITGVNTVCQNSNGVVYHALGNDITDYSWSVVGGTIQGSSTLDSVVVDWGTTQMSSLTLTATNLCGSNNTSYNVNVIAPPTISAVDPTPICAPNTFDLQTISITTSTVGIVTYHNSQADAINGVNPYTSFSVNTGGTYWIRLTVANNCFDVTSVDVVIENPQISVIDPQGTCQPNTINLDNVSVTETNGASALAAKTYHTSLADAQAGIGALSNVNIAQSGVFYVRYETVNGCFDVETINVTIYPQPDITITSSLGICTGSSMDLQNITFTDANSTNIVDTMYFASLVSAQFGIPGLEMSNTVVSTPGPFYIRLNTIDGCFLIQEINITIYNLPTASISTNGAACYNENLDITFNLTGVGPFDVTYTDGTNNFNLTGISDGHIAQHLMTGNASFAVTTVTDQGSGCSNSGGLAVGVVTNQELNVSLTGDNSICEGSSTDLILTITGDGPYEVVYTDGTNNYTESNITSSPHTISVSPSSDVTYSLVSATDNLGCSGNTNGTANILVGTQISASNFSENCNALLTGYTISVDVSGGVPANYVVSGITGSFSGNTFTTDEIVAGGSYNFSISDGSACPPVSFSGSYDCQCTTEPGTMDQNQITVCQGQLAVAPASTGTILDPGFIQIYYLHDNAGNTIGNVFGQNSVPEFTFVTGMTLGATYYISSVVGPDNGVGGHDTTDPCYQVSIGTPVVFLGRADANIGGSISSCIGADVFIDINIAGGVSPFDITYSDGTNSFTLNGVVDGSQIQVNPTSTTTYTLTSIVDQTASLCDGLVSGTYTVNVTENPMAVNVDTICDGTNTNFQVVFEITGGDAASYVVTGDAGTLDPTSNIFTSDWLPNGSSFSFSYDDVNGCGPFLVEGSHLCDCDTDAGTMSSTQLDVCSSANTLFNLIAPVNLDSDDARGYIMHNGISTIPFTIYQSSPNPEFTFIAGMTYGMTYYVSSIVGNDDGSGFPVTDIALDPCLSISNGQPVVFYPEAVASISGDATLCEGDVSQLLVEIDIPGDFNLVYNLGAGDVTQNAISDGEFINLNLAQTTQIDLISVQAVDGPQCIGTVDPTSSQVNFTINELPEASEPLLTCDADGAFYTVEFSINGGNSAGYSVLGAGNLVGNVFISDPIANNTSFNFEITDGTGCPPVLVSNTHVCLCTADILVDVIEEASISCFEGDNGVVSAAPTNGASPYDYVWSNGVQGAMNSNVPAGVYKVTMTDANGCVKEDSLEIFSPAPIVANYSTVDANCHDSADGQLSVTSIQGGIGEYTIEVGGSSQVGSPVTFDLPGGTYDVMIFDENDCLSTAEVTVDAPLPFLVELGSDLIIEQGESVTLTSVTNGPLDSLSWINVPDSLCTWCESQEFQPVKSGTFGVQAWNIYGCMAEAFINITVEQNRPMFIPNVFSPNADGDNDKFSIFASPSVERIISLKIFSRWGELVYDTRNQNLNDETVGWDGRFRGKPMDEGVYIYSIEVEYIDGVIELHSGDLTLLR